MFFRLLLHLSFHVSFAWLFNRYIQFWRLRYDEQDASCEYYRAINDNSIWAPTWAFAVEGLTFVVTFMEGGVHYAIITLFFASLCAMLVMWAVIDYRFTKNRRALSARYLQHKYGANFAHLIHIMEDNGLSMFPLLRLEHDMGVGAEEKKALLCTDAAMREKVCKHIEELYQACLKRREHEKLMRQYQLSSDLSLSTNNELCTLLWHLRQEVDKLFGLPDIAEPPVKVPEVSTSTTVTSSSST
jgi:hypothetical protein